jgi:uncharacterized protein YeeX (DUF496 family)
MGDKLYDNEIYILKLATNPETYDTLTSFMTSQTRHSINESKMKEWIDNQPYTLFKNVAQYICNNITYISVKEVIQKIKNVGTYIYERHSNQGHNFVFHVTNYIGLEQKSNSFFTVLVMSYIYKTYKTFFPVTIDLENSVNEKYGKYGYDVFYLDIDDMCYTGTQTRAQLEHIFLNNITNQEMFRKKIKYEIIRLYITDIAIDTIKGDPKIFPITIIKDTKLRFNEKINSCFEIFEKAGRVFSKVYSAINTLFFNLRTFPVTITYFDHKIADLPSTCSFMLTNGFIPSTSLINRVLQKKTKNNKYSYSHVNDDILNLIRTLLYSEDESYSEKNDKKCNFINFVDNCSSALSKYGECHDENNKAINNINQIILNDKYDYESTINDQINKCPTPYYKSKEYKNIVDDLLINENYIGNTKMHELFNSGDIEAIKLYINSFIDKKDNSYIDILFKRNIIGFTPFFYLKLSNKTYDNFAKKIIDIIHVSVIIRIIKRNKNNVK